MAVVYKSVPLPGFNAHLLVQAGGSGAFHRVAALRDLTLNVDSNEIDISSHDTEEWVETMAGLKRWTLTAGALYIEKKGDASTDPASDDDEFGDGQMDLFGLIIGPSLSNKVVVRMAPRGSIDAVTGDLDMSDTQVTGLGPKNGWFFQGEGTVGRWSLAAPQTDADAVNVEIRGKSPLSKVGATVPA